jgi:hypothetical protein
MQPSAKGETSGPDEPSLVLALDVFVVVVVVAVVVVMELSLGTRIPVLQ